MQWCSQLKGERLKAPFMLFHLALECAPVSAAEPCVTGRHNSGRAGVCLGLKHVLTLRAQWLIWNQNSSAAQLFLCQFSENKQQPDMWKHFSICQKAKKKKNWCLAYSQFGTTAKHRQQSWRQPHYDNKVKAANARQRL